VTPAYRPVGREYHPWYCSVALVDPASPPPRVYQPVYCSPAVVDPGRVVPRVYQSWYWLPALVDATGDPARVYQAAYWSDADVVVAWAALVAVDRATCGAMTAAVVAATTTAISNARGHAAVIRRWPVSRP
jgi:hypothetical protein